ncbi:MAG TPA: c-type cytochrome [Planktothrix sp.]|jgi:mono/diheme cytochrome c family protein
MQRKFFNVMIQMAVAVPLVASLASCGGMVKVDNSNQVQPEVTQGKPEPLYPNDLPSSADGKLVYAAQNCAQCHGADGKGGSAKIDFTNTEYMDKQKPVDQYMFVAYGKQGANPHPATVDKLTTRQIWNLVFYTRSLARPVIAPTSNPEHPEEYLALDAVFGSNCVVCHGKKGNGDGPLAHDLEPIPANFAQFPRFYDRTDAVLWDHIANGIQWEGMPNFLNKEDKAKNVKFDKDYIWKLVAYVRHFQSTDIPTTVIAESNNTQGNEANKSTQGATGRK